MLLFLVTGRGIREFCGSQYSVKVGSKKRKGKGNRKERGTGEEGEG